MRTQEYKLPEKGNHYKKATRESGTERATMTSCPARKATAKKAEDQDQGSLEQREQRLQADRERRQLSEKSPETNVSSMLMLRSS